jgi:hypothetical protein
MCSNRTALSHGEPRAREVAKWLKCSLRITPSREYQLFRETRVAEAIKLSGTFHCVTSEGNITSRADDWLVVDSRGCLYPVNSAEFESVTNR